jgi:hypothetical protein
MNENEFYDMVKESFEYAVELIFNFDVNTQKERTDEEKDEIMNEMKNEKLSFPKFIAKKFSKEIKEFRKDDYQAYFND